MSVTFGYVHNTRTEHVIFDIVDMEYPYNAIIGRGTLNAFEAILHPTYLCMKIPSPGAPLLLYVAASHSAVSAALVQEKLDGQIKKQAPVYFVSEVLSLSKKNYTELEKVLYAVLMASRKLRIIFKHIT
jgi:hypothetical protein